MIGVQSGFVRGEFGFERVDIGDRITTRFQRGEVDDVGENRTPLQVPQEFQPESSATRCARNEARHVGDGEHTTGGLHDAEVGLQCGERIVGDLRLGRREHRHQRRLARRREANESDVGDGLQFENEIAVLPLLTEEREARRLARLGRQRRVAESATSARGGVERRTLPDQVGKDRSVLVEHDGAVRHVEDQIVAIGAAAVIAHAGRPVTRLGMRPEVKIEQCVHLRVDDERHGPTVATVTTVGSAERLELLPMHRRTAVATIARSDVNRHPVDEPRHDVLSRS